MPRLATLSSTAATPWGRSVTDSSRFTLIMPLLLSGRDQQQLPSLAQSRACNPDQTSEHQLRSAGTDRTPPPESQNALLRIPAGPAASSRRLPAISSESPHRLPVQSRDRSRRSSSLRV